MSFWLLFQWAAVGMFMANLWFAAFSRNDHRLRFCLFMAGLDVLFVLVAEVVKHV